MTASSSSDKPALVFVHGSWFTQECWCDLISLLRVRGYTCSTVSLPSTQSAELPPATLTDDTTAINSEVERQLQTNNVIVIAHSYGGVPTNNALKGFDQKSRLADSKTTFVEKILFIASMPVPPGTNMLAVLGGGPGPIHDMRTQDFAWVGPPGPGYYFFNNHTAEEAEYWSSTLKQQSWKAYEEKTTNAAYMEIPSHYLFCGKDQACLPEWQEGIVAGAKAAGALFVGSERIDTDHCPFIGKTAGETADFVRRAAGENDVSNY